MNFKFYTKFNDYTNFIKIIIYLDLAGDPHLFLSNLVFFNIHIRNNIEPIMGTKLIRSHQPE